MSIKQQTRPKSPAMQAILAQKGNVEKIMEYCQVTRAAVYYWYEPPLYRAEAVARAIGWDVTDVRPDYKLRHPNHDRTENGTAD